MGRLTAAIKNFDGLQIQSFLKNGYEHILIDGHEFRLETEDLEISAEAKDGFVTLADRHMIVALNTELSEDLKEEGFAREFVNRVQNLRKEAGFDVTDHVIIQIEDIKEENGNALLRQKPYICNETLADDIRIGMVDAEFKKEVSIDQQTLMIGLIRK